MEAIKTRGAVNSENQLIVQLPEATKVGSYELIVVFLDAESRTDEPVGLEFSDYELPIEDMTFSRSEIDETDVSAPTPQRQWAGSLSKETGKKMLEHLDELRNEWERNI
jgi:hypothetical protein